MGLFGTFGIIPVHQDLKDAGVRFGTLEERSVVIHDQCFSPENAMLQLDDSGRSCIVCPDCSHSHAVEGFHIWFSAASFGDKRVIVRHVVALQKVR